MHLQAFLGTPQTWHWDRTMGVNSTAHIEATVARRPEKLDLVSLVSSYEHQNDTRIRVYSYYNQELIK
jgi:hypothetical protein